jgi:hypothetical protein
MPGNGRPDPTTVLPITPDQNREFHQALQRVLDSPSFASSRRLSGFLAYIASAALSGRTEIDQYEIAERVLNRQHDFNPLDDASVRKLASQIRAKLAEYYEGEGASDPVVIGLPRRSYLPRFRYRSSVPPPPDAEDVEFIEAEPTRAPAPPPELEQQPAPVPTVPVAWRPFALGVLAAAIVVAAVLLWYVPNVLRQEKAPSPVPAIVIDTASGDLRGPILDVAPDAVQIGPPVGPTEEVTAVLQFTPEYPTQQAGIMAFSNPDQFVRFGYHFKSRPMLEFGFETDGRYHGPQSTYLYDLLAQTNLFRWLSIRRAGDIYEAFESSDGLNWRSFGLPLKVASEDGQVLAALYAFNGRSQQPPARAEFRKFRTGLSFHHRAAGPTKADAFPGWTVEQSCREPIDVRIAAEALQIGFPQAAMGCEWLMFRAVPSGEWSFSTLLDFVPVSGSSAGLRILGTKGNLTVSRRDLMGGSIILERLDDNDIRAYDFRGTPPVTLRLERRDGRIAGSFSRDGMTYAALGPGLPVDQLGELRGIGLVTSIAHWASEYSRPPARFYRVEQEILNPVSLSK